VLLLVLLLSSDAISADAGYRSPTESKRRGPAIGEEQVAWICDLSDLLLP
jgi:hypothetical protein